MNGTASALVLGFLLATAYGAGFHVLLGGPSRRIILYLIAAWLGFSLGHILGDLLKASTGEGLSVPTIAATFEAHVEDLKVRSRAVNSMRNATISAKGFLESIGPKRAGAPVSTLSVREVEAWIARQRAAGLSVASVKAKAIPLRAALAAAVRRNEATVNPFKSIRWTDTSEKRAEYRA